MGTGMRLRHGLLLCVLALAVLGMHHLALAPHTTSCHQPVPPTTASASHMGGPSGHASGVLEAGMLTKPPSAHSAGGPATGTGHDLMHLCLAVLTAAGWLLLLTMLWTAVGEPERGTARLRLLATHAWRRRRTTGRSLLTSVCVLRI